MAMADFSNRAEKLLRATAARVTRGRIAVLAVLLESRCALTHHEVEEKLGRIHDIDRVTVYRVLEWLTDNGLAHRLSADDRVWRFTSVDKKHGGNHPHFNCVSCGEMICLKNGIEFPRIPVPSGYKGTSVEVLVKGHCPDCAVRKKSLRAIRRETRPLR